MARVEVSVMPVGQVPFGLNEYANGCFEILEKAEGIIHELTPTGTIIEGELGRIMEVVMEMHEYPFVKGIERVITSITIDDERYKESAKEAENGK